MDYDDFLYLIPDASADGECTLPELHGPCLRDGSYIGFRQ